MFGNISHDYHLKLTTKELVLSYTVFRNTFLEIGKRCSFFNFFLGVEGGWGGGNPLKRTEPENLNACFPKLNLELIK